MLKRARAFVGFVFTVLLSAGTLVSVAHASDVPQSYTATSSLQPGVIVRLGNASSSVEALSQTDSKKMFGVVINPNEATVSLSVTSSNQVYVASSGTYSVLVSNQNGPIKIGDYITISSLNGLGMKASSSDSTVLGKATSTFGGAGDSLGTAKLSNGTLVHLGRISVAINVGKNPLIVPAKNSLPAFLRNAGQSISNKPLSATKAYLCLAILLISAIMAGSLLYAGVRSSIVSIGRNPLSKKSIVRGLLQVTFTSLIVFAVGLFAVYLLLRF